MNWQALPQDFGLSMRETPQSVQSERGSGGASGGVHNGGHNGGEVSVNSFMRGRPSEWQRTMAESAASVTLW